ncbi:MAG TPA: hypothetical protein DIU15_05940 [Deltaproteobacteria bacterium]|nr:hypothetical protein [Deltaproteobacteria bacterium]HCP45560.1 hypothetical protein [Deltaproteobacteria bacterium]
MNQPADSNTWKPLGVLTLLLVLFAGPIFGPITTYAKAELGVRAGTGLVVALFVVVFVALALGTIRWVKSQGWTLHDLGWGASTRISAVVGAVFFGVLWAAFNVMGYIHQIDPEADPWEISALRVGTAIGGVIIACSEDLMTRGFIMNHLKNGGVGPWRQALVSSAVFALYHSLWTLSIAGFIVSFFIGLIMAGFFLWGRRSLTPVIVAHGLCLFLGEPFLTMFMLAAG